MVSSSEGWGYPNKSSCRNVEGGSQQEESKNISNSFLGRREMDNSQQQSVHIIHLPNQRQVSRGMRNRNGPHPGDPHRSVRGGDRPPCRCLGPGSKKTVYSLKRNSILSPFQLDTVSPPSPQTRWQVSVACGCPRFLLHISPAEHFWLKFHTHPEVVPKTRDLFFLMTLVFDQRDSVKWNLLPHLL